MNVLLFGITQDIIGLPVLKLALENTVSVKDLKIKLLELYPDLRSLESVRIAVNNRYAEEDQFVGESDEIALIPPVSGG